MKKMDRPTRGMNTPNAPKKTIEAKDVGRITDGVELSKGYKTLSDNVGMSKRAVPQNKG